MASRKNLLQVKDLALGPDYDLSFAFITAKRSRELNRRYRGEDDPTAILSFPLDRREGEILINRRGIKAEQVLPLFIHGLLHLKGLVHGSKMRREERRLIKLFTHHGQNNRRRSGYRHLRDSPRRRRSGPGT